LPGLRNADVNEDFAIICKPNVRHLRKLRGCTFQREFVVRIPTTWGLERHHDASRFRPMATHLGDVSVSPCASIARDDPGSDPDQREVAGGAPNAERRPDAGAPVRVPNVSLESEARAVERIEAAGLVAGRRIPGPRPASHRSEVVVRTYPRAGTLVQAGSTVDYELLPGEPRQHPPTGEIGHAAAEGQTAGASVAIERTGARRPSGWIDTLDPSFRFRGWPIEGRA
jgi:hypothetical protein